MGDYCGDLFATLVAFASYVPSAHASELLGNYKYGLCANRASFRFYLLPKELAGHIKAIIISGYIFCQILTGL